MRTCPQCSQDFSRAEVKDKKRYCPHCGIEIFYPNGRLKGRTMLMADKECADRLVKRLLEVVSSRDCQVEASIPFLIAEKAYAYQLILKARDFVIAQPKNQLTYHELLEQSFEKILSNNWWFSNINSLKMVQNAITVKFTEVWQEAARRRKMKEAETLTYTDVSAFRVPRYA